MICSFGSSIILTMFAGLFGVLAVATSATAIAQGFRRESSATLEDMGVRIRTWWVMVAAFGAALLVARDTAIVFFAIVSFLALREYLSLVPTRRADRRAVLLAYLTIPIQYWLVHMQRYGLFLVFIPVYALLFLPARLVLAGETAGFLQSVGTIQWGLMLTVFGLSHVAFLLVQPLAAAGAAGGAGLVLYLVLLTEGNDVAQYLWGKSFGRIRIVPSVSPNKTWAGFLGGVATTTILGVVAARWLTALSPRQAALGALIIAVSGFAGDVVVSALKRDLGVKDTGSLLPGHGGILDRIDSLTYTAPLFFHYVHLLNGGAL